MAARCALRLLLAAASAGAYSFAGPSAAPQRPTCGHPPRAWALRSSSSSVPSHRAARADAARPLLGALCAGARATAAQPLARAPRAASPAMIVVDAKLLAAGVGGTFAGGLHAITGPDHLAALLPLCMGRRWFSAVYTGAYWGLGHGIGASLVGALAYAVRGALNIDAFSTYMEALVGLSIIIIGINGIRESREWEADLKNGGPTEVASAHSVDVALRAPVKATGVLATLFTGVLHGCSGSGHLLGVMPALAMPSWLCASTYLVAFGLGTMAAMSVFTAVVGELSTRMSDSFGDGAATPAKLALVSSVFAVGMGSLWTARACVMLGLPQAMAGLGAAALRKLARPAAADLRRLIR